MPEQLLYVSVRSCSGHARFLARNKAESQNRGCEELLLLWLVCAQDRLLGADSSPWVVSASKKKAAEDEIAALEASWHAEAEQEADESDEECGIPASHRHGSPTGKQGLDLMAAKQSRQAR